MMTSPSNIQKEDQAQFVRLDYARPAPAITASRVFAGLWSGLLIVFGIFATILGMLLFVGMSGDGGIMFGMAVILLGIVSFSIASRLARHALGRR
jgi:uncharacterized membrane protein (DUF485 family)